jgi:hypothetical protein
MNVNYNVFIKKCSNRVQAAKIAEAIAKRSGTSPDAVLAVLIDRAVCIKKDADQNETIRLKEEFEAVGAEIEIVSVAAGAGAGGQSDDDDEDGRMLTEAEYIAKLNARKDIFVTREEKSFKYITIFSVIFSIILGIWLSNREVAQTANDFYEKIPDQVTAKLVKNQKEPDKLKIEDKNKQKNKDKTPETSKPVARSSGSGDPRAKLTQKGVLAIISGKASGKSVASADIFGKSGFASDIDGILNGVGGLKTSGSAGLGRKGVSGVGFGAGYTGGGGGNGNVDDIIGGLLSDGGSGRSSMALKQSKTKGEIKVPEPSITKGGSLTGGRSRAMIMRVVNQNLAALRYAYNKRLREKPGLRGKITCKFAIDEFGKVIYCQVIETTMEDSELEADIVDKIKRWVFDKVDKPGDVTEIVYPFVFSQ